MFLDIVDTEDLPPRFQGHRNTPSGCLSLIWLSSGRRMFPLMGLETGVGMRSSRVWSTAANGAPVDALCVAHSNEAPPNPLCFAVHPTPVLLA